MAPRNETAGDPPELTQDYLFREFLDPLAGKEAEFERWNEEEHLRDVVATPGFLSARRYLLADHQIDGRGPRKPKHMNTYHVRSADAPTVRADLDRRLQSGEIKFSEAVDHSSLENYTFHLLKRSFTGAAGLSAMEAGQPDYLEQMFDDPAPGQDAALNSWYDDWIAGLMTNPHLINAYRGLWSDVQFGPGKHTSKYFAQIAIRAPDLPAFAASIRGLAPPPNIMDQSKAFRYTYKAVGGYVMGAKVREERAAK